MDQEFERRHFSLVTALSRLFFYWCCFLFCLACWYGVFRLASRALGWDQ